MSVNCFKMTPWLFDTQALLWLNFDGGGLVDTLMWWISGKWTWVPLYAAVVAWVFWRKGWRTGVLFVVAASLMILCADQTASFFKHALPKFRPTHTPEIAPMVHTVGGYLGGLYGTVSSHAANSLAFMLLSSSVVRNRYYTVLMLLWVVALCYSRLYLGVHFPMDIIFGLLDGALWGSFWWVVYKNMAKKHYICRLKS